MALLRGFLSESGVVIIGQGQSVLLKYLGRLMMHIGQGWGPTGIILAIPI